MARGLRAPDRAPSVPLRYRRAMAPELRPLPTRFVPVARLAFVAGALLAMLAAISVKRAEAADGAAVVERGGAASVLVGPIVAHVWLENCADCMPAFQAHKTIQEAHLLQGIPQVNVAYGASTPVFRARYRVDTQLIEDTDGSKVVHPLGITSFTTLVIDAHGAVLWRDRPDRAGYVDRVRDAWMRVR